MGEKALTVIYVGGPTVLLEFAGLRFLTDPTFDPAGGEYRTGPVTLRKLTGPAWSQDELGAFDYVLLSHDHHSDNLDHTGRAALANAKAVLTTEEGAQRLGGNAVGLKDWQTAELPAPDSAIVRVVATPARHGPEGLGRGAVNGFVLVLDGDPEHAIYISGDTVWYEGVEEVARRFSVCVAMLHLGAARVPEVGPYHLTMTAKEAVQVAHTFPNAVVIPIHFEGWAHFSEGRREVEEEFANAGLKTRLRWPEAGQPVRISLA